MDGRPENDRRLDDYRKERPDDYRTERRDDYRTERPDYRTERPDYRTESRLHVRRTEDEYRRDGYPRNDIRNDRRYDYRRNEYKRSVDGSLYFDRNDRNRYPEAYPVETERHVFRDADDLRTRYKRPFDRLYHDSPPINPNFYSQRTNPNVYRDSDSSHRTVYRDSDPSLVQPHSKLELESVHHDSKRPHLDNPNSAKSPIGEDGEWIETESDDLGKHSVANADRTRIADIPKSARSYDSELHGPPSNLQRQDSRGIDGFERHKSDRYPESERNRSDRYSEYEMHRSDRYSDSERHRSDRYSESERPRNQTNYDPQRHQNDRYYDLDRSSRPYDMERWPSSRSFDSHQSGRSYDIDRQSSGRPFDPEYTYGRGYDDQNGRPSARERNRSYESESRPERLSMSIDRDHYLPDDNRNRSREEHQGKPQDDYHTQVRQQDHKYDRLPMNESRIFQERKHSDFDKRQDRSKLDITDQNDGEPRSSKDYAQINLTRSDSLITSPPIMSRQDSKASIKIEPDSFEIQLHDLFQVQMKIEIERRQLEFEIIRASIDIEKFEIPNEIDGEIAQ